MSTQSAPKRNKRNFRVNVSPPPDALSLETAIQGARALLGPGASVEARADPQRAQTTVIEGRRKRSGPGTDARDAGAVAKLIAERLGAHEERRALGHETGVIIEMGPGLGAKGHMRWIGIVVSRWHDTGADGGADEAWETFNAVRTLVRSAQPLQSPAGAEHAPLYVIPAGDGSPRERAVCAFSLDPESATRDAMRFIAAQAAAKRA